MEFVRILLCVLSVLVALVSERFAVLAAFSQSLDSDFTFTLPPGRKECFYQTMRQDASLEIEYQVSLLYDSVITTLMNLRFYFLFKILFGYRDVIIVTLKTSSEYQMWHKFKNIFTGGY